MKTPPDFAPPPFSNGLEGMTHEASTEFRRVYSKLDAISDQLAVIRTDRKWFLWIAGAVLSVALASIVMVQSWSLRLATVEKETRAHIDSSVEIHNGLRRDITRNTIDIEKLNTKTWRPRGADKEE